MRLPKNRPPTHPGEVLLQDCLEPLGLTQTEFAAKIGISRIRVNEIVQKKRSVTPDTALRLARFFGNDPEFWLNLQLAWDLWHAQQAPEAREIEKIEPAVF